MGKKVSIDVWYFFSLSNPNKCSCTHISVLKLIMVKNVKIMIFSALKSKFYQYVVLTKNYSNDVTHVLLNFSAGIFQIEPRNPHQLKVSLALI